MNISIKKELNLIVFIGEIAEIRQTPWNKERRREYIKTTGGSLTKKEKEQIKIFKSLFLNTSYDAIEACFVYCTKKGELQKQLKEYLSDEQIDILYFVMNFFAFRFEMIWKKKNKKLLYIKNIIQKNKTILKKIFVHINTLCEKTKDKKNIPTINLVINSNNRKDVIGWFSMLEKNINLVLEYSNKPTPSFKRFIFAVIVHEVFHAKLRENKKIFSNIIKIAKDNKKYLNSFNTLTPGQVLEELLISSFVPEGILASKYLKTKIETVISYKNRRKPNFVLARRYCAYKMKKITSFYLENNKSIDRNILIAIVDIIKKGGNLPPI